MSRTRESIFGDFAKQYRTWVRESEGCMREAFHAKGLTDEQARGVAQVAEGFDLLVKGLEQICPLGRYYSLVMTKLEEAAMFATKSITHESE